MSKQRTFRWDRFGVLLLVPFGSACFIYVPIWLATHYNPFNLFGATDLPMWIAGMLKIAFTLLCLALLVFIVGCFVGIWNWITEPKARG